MSARQRLKALERRLKGTAKPHPLVALEVRPGEYQGSDGRTYSGPELEALAAQGRPVLQVRLRPDDAEN